MENIISVIPEEEYESTMKNTVLPALYTIQKEWYLERISGKIQYCSVFPAENPQGVILISHGFSESSEKFFELAYYFHQAGYHVVIPDHLGHGNSYRLTDDPSLIHVDRWQTYVHDLFSVTDCIRKNFPNLPIYLFGHSMGGGIAAAAAALSPEGTYQKVILSSPMIQPLTANLPLTIAQIIADILCAAGKSAAYAPGHHPFTDSETFENSAALSEARFRFYHERQIENVHLQTCAASLGWLKEALRLSQYLRHHAWKKITAPVLLLQAGNDAFVSNDAQDQFIQHLSLSEKVLYPNAKHELYRMSSEDLSDYLGRILDWI